MQRDDRLSGQTGSGRVTVKTTRMTQGTRQQIWLLSHLYAIESSRYKNSFWPSFQGAHGKFRGQQQLSFRRGRDGRAHLPPRLVRRWLRADLRVATKPEDHSWHTATLTSSH